jgi:hypothetical protein
MTHGYRRARGWCANGSRINMALSRIRTTTHIQISDLRPSARCHRVTSRTLTMTALPFVYTSFSPFGSEASLVDSARIVAGLQG